MRDGGVRVASIIPDVEVKISKRANDNLFVFKWEYLGLQLGLFSAEDSVSIRKVNTSDSGSIRYILVLRISIHR